MTVEARRLLRRAAFEVYANRSENTEVRANLG
jgi:hypothetical protein